jgi:hypothetical protein
MKAAQTKPRTSKKRSASGAAQAMSIAFRELVQRSHEQIKAARDRSRAEKDRQWQGAAKRFKGLSEALKLRLESRNIDMARSGYKVRFRRDGKIFRRSFHGLSEESLSAAVKFRDEALKILGENHQAVPAHVLKALGLSLPVPGISRMAAKSSYKVTNSCVAKSPKQTDFSFKFLAEEDAYAAAIECLEAGLKSK